MAARVFHHPAGIEPRRGGQTAGQAVTLQRGEAGFDVGPVWPGGIGQHFQLSFHPAAQGGAHRQQAFHRGDRPQGDDDAAFHSAGETEPET